LAESAEFRDVLAQCLSRLPSRIAQVFWLREAEEVETSQFKSRRARWTRNPRFRAAASIFSGL
jgi:hypothetical protein